MSDPSDDRLEQRAVVPLFEPHHLLLDRLHGLRQLEERLDDFSLGRFIGQGWEKRVNARDPARDHIAGGANLGNGCGSVHLRMMRGPAL